MDPSQDPATNPYAAPTADLGTAATQYGDDDATLQLAEPIRREHLSHEASVRSVGLLYLLGGFFGVLSLIGLLVSGGFALSGQGGMGAAEASIIVVTLLITGGFTAVQILLGLGLRWLKGWARIGTILMTGLTLAYFAFVMAVSTLGGGMPIGGVIMLLFFTAIPSYIMWLMLCAKGRYVFTPEYQAIRAVTPHIKYQTSIIVKIAIALLLVIILIGIIALFVSG